MRQLLCLRIFTLILGVGFLSLTQISNGGDDLTWTGGGDGTSFSDDGNWTADFGSGPVDAAPSFDFNDDSLKFNSTGTTVNNDLDPANNTTPGTPVILGLGAGTQADSASFHFQDGSGDFTINGFEVMSGNGANGTLLRMEANAGTTQTLDLPISIGGGQKNHEIRILNGGTAIFNGAIEFNNSRLFPNEGAGRIELNGNNTGVGLGLYNSTSDEVALHTNGGRSVLRNNVAFTTLSLGSDTALGEAGTGTWDAGDLQFRGLQGNQILTIETDGPRDLSGYHFQLANGSGGGAIRFNNADDASIGYVTRSGNGTRGLSVTGAGVLSIDGGVFTSTTDQARDITLFAGGTGGNVANSNGQLVVNGRLFTSLVDPTSQVTNGTSATGGIVAGLATDVIPGKQILAADGVTPINGIVQFRFGTMTLNGDSSSTWIGGQVTANVGSKIVMGHENAFGDSTSLIAVQNNSTIDLNGHTLIQSFAEGNNGLGGTGFNGEGAIINSDVTTEGVVASEILNVGNFSVGGAGDVRLNNVLRVAGVQRLLTKVGAGTLTLGGDLANARYGLTVDEGTVLLSKDDGTGVAASATTRFDVVINNGSSVVIANSAEKTAIGSGINDQIDDLMLVNITDGSLDLAGNREGIGRLSGGSTSTVSSSLAAFHGNADARIAIGESTLAAAQGDGAGAWAGTIQDGVSAVSVSVNGGIQQSFTGANTYSGETIVSSSVVSTLLEPPSTNLIVDGSITGTSKVTVEAGAILSGTGTVASPDWDISGVISPGGAAPSTSDVLTLDYSSSDGSGFVIIQDNAELNFVLDSGLNNSSIDLLGSSLSTVIIGDAIINLTDLAAGSLTNGDYILVDGDADTTLSLTGTIGLTGLDAYASSSVALVGNDIVLSISNDVAPLPGDFNADGTVDAADYTVYRDNLGLDNAVLNGNGTLGENPGVVLPSDYNIWVANYGASNSFTTSSAVPEPTSLLLMAAGLAFSGLSRRVS